MMPRQLRRLLGIKSPSLSAQGKEWHQEPAQFESVYLNGTARLRPITPVEAWTDPGPVPKYHRQMQATLRSKWPVLAGALDMAASKRPPQPYRDGSLGPSTRIALFGQEEKRQVITYLEHQIKFMRDSPANTDYSAGAVAALEATLDYVRGYVG